MILTITMNPSIDISYPLETLKIDTVNRVNNVSKTAGGKGLNVTRVLKGLDEKVIASGIIGGNIGNMIIEQLDSQEISSNFYVIEQETRNCIAILHDDGSQTEILESGPILLQEDSYDFMEFFSSSLSNIDLVTMSGSLPQGLDSNYYSKMIDVCSEKNIPVILDSSGTSLENVIANASSKPFLIKPNEEELSNLLSTNIELSNEALIEVLSSKIFDGIEWIVVSLGSEGAFSKHNNIFYKVSIPSISVVNPVGSGDATVAGLASAIVKNKPDEDILKYGMTAGMLNAQERVTGHINSSNFDILFNQVTVEKITNKQFF